MKFFLKDSFGGNIFNNLKKDLRITTPVFIIILSKRLHDHRHNINIFTGDKQMIRDMELLLNSVYDEEIKMYLKEALDCYSAEAYRACIIMSLIGGIHDLHNKIKGLTQSNHDISELEKEVSELKKSLKPYERFLIDKCATKEIDLLSTSDAKELNRCFDIRNDCAHPSDYNCTAETARYVFSTVIDILASKPVLLGQQHIKELVENINSDTYFPRIDKIEIREFVISQLKLYSMRIYKPLALKLVKQIDSDTVKSNKNKQFFLANMADSLNTTFDTIVNPLFISSKNDDDIMNMVVSNISLVEYLSDENIKRLLRIFKKYIVNDLGYNQVIIDILKSNRLIHSCFNNNISDVLNLNFQEMSDNQCSVWISLMSSGSFEETRMQVIKDDYSVHVKEYLSCSNLSFTSQSYQKIFAICNDSALFSSLVINITNKIASSNYNISNPAVTKLEEFSEELIQLFNNTEIKWIIYSILDGHQGYGRSATNLLNNINNNYVFKVYLKNIAPLFSNEDLKEMLTYKLLDNTFIIFVNAVNVNIPSFIDDFIGISQNYIDENGSVDDSDTNVIILSNVIRKLSEQQTKMEIKSQELAF